MAREIGFVCFVWAGAYDAGVSAGAVLCLYGACCCCCAGAYSKFARARCNLRTQLTRKNSTRKLREKSQAEIGNSFLDWIDSYASWRSLFGNRTKDVNILDQRFAVFGALSLLTSKCLNKDDPVNDYDYRWFASFRSKHAPKWHPVFRRIRARVYE